MQLIAPKIIICETGARWAAAWQRCAAKPDVRADVVNEHSACDVLIAAAPCSFVVLAVERMHIAHSLEWLTRRRLEAPDLAVAIVGDAELECWRGTLLECGALLIVTSERQLPYACAASRQHLARWQPPQRTHRERIWASLPWRDARTIQ